MNSQTAEVTIIFTLIIAGILIFIRQILYKTRQLSAQNKLLLALQELDGIILTKSVTDIDTLAQNIVNLALKQLGYFFISIALIDYKKRTVRRVAISETPGLRDNQRYIPLPINQQEVSLDTKDNLYVRAVLEKRSFSSRRLYDIHKGIFTPQISDEMQKKLRIKGVVVFPMFSENKVFGVIGYGSGTALDRLTKFEYSIMGDFAAEVARSLDHVLLYQNLKVTSQALEDANFRLKDLDLLKDEFVSVASHELRTPMTAIRSYVWMALHRSDVPLSQKLQRYLYRTLISTERLINLVSDMLNLSRIESGKIEISPKAVDLIALVKDVVEDIQLKAAEKKLQILTLEDRLPPVFADPEKVQQILLNLLGNALKFTFPGGIISVSFFTDGNMVETHIKDNGQGISPQDLGKLFKKFGRLDNSYVSLSTSGGTGLGLYISRSLVELMHGKVWASSEGEGKGSTFAFSLPIASSDIIRDAEKYHVKPREGEAKPLEPVAI